MDLDKTLVVFDSPSPPSSLLLEVPRGWDPRVVPCLVSTGGLSGGSRDGAWCLISPAGFILPFHAPPEAERAKYAHGCLAWLEPCGSPCLAPHLHHTIQTYPQHYSGGTQNCILSIQLYSPCLSSPPILNGATTSHNGLLWLMCQHLWHALQRKGAACSQPSVY